MNVPCLMICHNRIEYTKKALTALAASDCGQIVIIDNGSTDGTVEWLKQLVQFPKKPRAVMVLNKENEGVAGAMNRFLELTTDYEFVAKIDNDTLVEPLWCNKLLEVLIKYKLGIVQARHPIIKATHTQGWEGYTKNMKQIAPGVYENSYVGGSGIVFRRSIIKDKLPEDKGVLGGWFHWQKSHPEVRKAFCEDVTIELLDAHGYSDFPEYYKKTGRI